MALVYKKYICSKKLNVKTLIGAALECKTFFSSLTMLHNTELTWNSPCHNNEMNKLLLPFLF